jgi:hypothetical protein
MPPLPVKTALLKSAISFKTGEIPAVDRREMINPPSVKCIRYSINEYDAFIKNAALLR